MVAATLSLVVGTGGSAQAAVGGRSPATSRTNTLTWIYDALTWASLDPSNPAFRGLTQPIDSLIFGNLFDVGPNNSFLPGLALTHTISPNGLTFTMTLRHGVKFQDGTPFNAAAVKDSLATDLLPQSGCTCRNFLLPVKSITTPNNFEVQLHFSNRDGTIMAALSGSAAAFVPSPTAVASEGSNFGIKPVGAGPFKVVNNVVSSSLTMDSWSGYWDYRAVHLASVNFLSGTNPQSEVATLQSGGAQILTISVPSAILQAKSDSSLNVHTALGYGSLVYLNPGKAPFNNPVAREAVLYATDAKPIDSSVYEGQYPVTEQLAGSGMIGYPGNTVSAYPKYDLTKAESLVKQLGGLSFSLNCGNTTLAVAACEALDQEWSAAGMTVTINELSGAAGIAADEAGNYQATNTAYSAQPDAIGSLLNVIGCPSVFNPSYCDTKVQNVLVQAASTSNLTRQAKLVNEAEQRAIVTDKDFVPLFEVPEVTFSLKSVKGLVEVGTALYGAGVSY